MNVYWLRPSAYLRYFSPVCPFALELCNQTLMKLSDVGLLVEDGKHDTEVEIRRHAPEAYLGPSVRGQFFLDAQARCS